MKNWYPLLRQLFLWLARLIGIIMLVYGVLTIIEQISNGDPYGQNDFEHTIRMIVYLLFLAVGVFIIFIIWWIKANLIAKLKSNNQTMISVAEIYIKGIGESWAAFLLCMMVPTVLTAFLFGAGQNSILPFEASTRFLAGLLMLVSNTLLSMIVLSISYFLANNLKGR